MNGQSTPGGGQATSPKSDSEERIGSLWILLWVAPYLWMKLLSDSNADHLRILSFVMFGTIVVAFFCRGRFAPTRWAWFIGLVCLGSIGRETNRLDKMARDHHRVSQELALYAPKPGTATWQFFRAKHTEDYWRRAVYELHRIHDAPPRDPNARTDQATLQMLKDLRVQIDAVRKLSTWDVDPDVEKLTHSLLAANERLWRGLSDLLIELNASGHSMHDERPIAQTIAEAPEAFERFLALDKSQVPGKWGELRDEIMETLELIAAADLEARILQARLVERYPLARFPLTSLVFDGEEFVLIDELPSTVPRLTGEALEQRKKATVLYWQQVVVPLANFRLAADSPTLKQLLAAIHVAENVDQTDVDPQLVEMVTAHLELERAVGDFVDFLESVARPGPLNERHDRPLQDAFETAIQLMEDERAEGGQTGEELTRVEQIYFRAEELGTRHEEVLVDRRVMAARLDERYPGADFSLPGQ